jgi:hypothetical protein
MEQQSFRPRANKAQWELVNDKLELVIYRDIFYHGYQMMWHGPVTDSNRSLILAMVKEIPSKPNLPQSKRNQIAALLDGKGPISKAESVHVANQIMKIVNAEEPDIPVLELKK